MKRVKTKYALVLSSFDGSGQFVYPLSLKAIAQALRWAEVGTIRTLKEEADAFPGFSMGHICQMFKSNNPRYNFPTEVAESMYIE